MPPLWELFCKFLVLALASLAIFGTCLLFLVGLMANGSAISDHDFSWKVFAFVATISGAQLWLIVLGTRAALRGVDTWSTAIYERRSARLERADASYR